MSGMKWLTLAALLGVSAHAAQVGSSSLTDSVWTLTQLAPRGEVVTPGALLRKPTLKVTLGGLLTGSTGCRGFAGWAAGTGNNLKVTPLKLSGTSRCSDHALSLEADFVKLLESATRFEISGQNLTIHGAGTNYVTFKAVKGEQTVTGNPPELESLKADWQLTGLVYRGQPVNVPSDSALSIRETDDGVQVRGQAGCNRLFGKVNLEGRTLSVSDLGMTRMMCPDMQAENAVVDIFGVPLAMTQEGDSLTLRNGRGELTLTRAAKAKAVFDAADLAGHAFTLNTVNGQPLGKTLKPVTLEFSERRVAGSDGCNSFGGEAVWNGSQLVVERLVSTLMACPDDDKVPSLTDLLKEQPSVRFSGRTLTLTAHDVTWEFQQQN